MDCRISNVLVYQQLSQSVKFLSVCGFVFVFCSLLALFTLTTLPVWGSAIVFCVSISIGGVLLFCNYPFSKSEDGIPLLQF
nr:hypothetical protein pmam_465 [Pithovirus mammoth]